jgi:serine/threonine protein kinase
VKQDSQQQADRIFSKAVDLATPQREVFLANSCGEDEDLRTEVDSLLSQYGTTEIALASADPSHTLSAGDPDEGSIAPPGAGDLLGNFRLLERLEGGDHDRFLAEAEGSRERVVLDVLSPELDANDVRRVRVESETITHLDHPGLLPLLEVGTAHLGTGPRAFTVTLESEHTQLMDWLRDHTPSLRSKIKLANRLLEAVVFAHGRGVLDGNLHPGRIVMDDLGRPKIQAIGLPRMLRALVNLPPDGLACRAPESMDTPWARLDIRADLFSLGGLLLWMMEGDLEGDDHTQVQLRKIIARAHAHEPQDRYNSVDAMLLELSRLEEQLETTHDQPLLEDLTTFVHSHPRATAVAIATVTLLLAAVIAIAIAMI